MNFNFCTVKGLSRLKSYINNYKKSQTHFFQTFTNNRSAFMNFRTFTNIVFLCLIVNLSSAWFVPDRLAVVDQKNKNFLIRGNLPMKDKQFQMDELKEALQNITHLQQGSYDLVVVSLMNGLTPKQAKNMYIEDKFFDQHPEYTYINNAVLGSFIDPKTLPTLLRELIAPMYESLSIDGMNNLLETFRKYMQNKKPTIVYFHCSQGVDRTGYVHAAYSMKYYKKSLEEAYKFNLQVLKNMRNRMHFNTYLGIEWYCLYLGRTQAECLKGLQN